MTTASKLLTPEEFYDLPTPPGCGKMELWDGEVVTMVPVGFSHGTVAMNIGSALRQFARTNKLGAAGVETGFRLAERPARVLAPDVYFLAAERMPKGDDADGFVHGAPSLGVEVVSPGDTDNEVARKVAAYLEAGSLRVWVVRPQQKTVTVHRPGGDAHTYGPGDVLGSGDAGFAVEGFALAVDDVFA
jgi:Uma2 family endonuclease